jgi:hypothetical protein
LLLRQIGHAPELGSTHGAAISISAIPVKLSEAISHLSRKRTIFGLETE